MIVNSTISRETEERLEFKKPDFAGLYWRNLAANTLGFMIIVVLNVFTPLEFFEVMRTFIFLEGHWKVFFLFYPLVMALVALLQYRIQIPIKKATVLLHHAEQVPESLDKKAKQRLLNLPYFIVMINLVMWIVVPALVVL